MDNALSKNTENNAKPMSDEEKFELSDRINHLQGDKLGKIVKIIRSHEPLSNDSDPDELLVDFDVLKPSTLRELKIFVASCFKNKSSSQSSGSSLDSDLSHSSNSRAHRD